MQRFICLALFVANLSCATASAAAQCAPATLMLIAHRKFAEARRSMNVGVGTKVSKDSELHCLGTLALEAHEYEAAVESFEEAIRSAPRPAHRVALAMALRSQATKAGMFRAAPLYTRMKSELETALSGDSSLIDAHFILLQLYAQVPTGLGGDMVQARKHAAILLRLNPARGHMGLGVIAEQEKNPTVAEREYRLAISVQPDSEPPYTSAGAFYWRQERWADAVSLFEKASRALPPGAFSSKRASVHYALGQVLEKTGTHARARAEYSSALKYNPDHAGAKQALGGAR